MNYETNLKARLFDAMDHNQHLKKRVTMLQKEIEERDEAIEEIRGDIHKLTVVAERRGDMVRELVAENRKLKQQLQTPVPSKEDIAHVQGETVEHIIYLIQEAYKKETGVYSF